MKIKSLNQTPPRRCFKRKMFPIRKTDLCLLHLLLKELSYYQGSYMEGKYEIYFLFLSFLTHFLSLSFIPAQIGTIFVHLFPFSFALSLSLCSLSFFLFILVPFFVSLLFNSLLSNKVVE